MKFMQIKPQKARGVLREDMWRDPYWIAEIKYDGDRRIGQFCAGDVRFTGTRESVDGTGYVEKTDNVPHLRGYSARVLDGTVLDGEMVHPHPGKGGGSKYVTQIMGCNPEKAVARQKEGGWLKYHVFDCLWFRGRDVRELPLHERRNLLEQALREWGNPHVSASKQSNGIGKKKFYEAMVRNGEEGVILKHRAHTYGNERLWVKVKGEWTADVVIMGFEPGKGKYKGQVGAIIFGQYKSGTLILKECGACSGFDDALRLQMMGMKRHSYVGQAIEIKHNGREPTGAFRHPRFKRFRPDKSSKDCVYREDEI